MVTKTAAIPNDFIHAMQVLRAPQILWYCRVKMKEMCIMKSNNNAVVPEAREALDKFKMEAAAEVGVNLKEGYNGNLTSREAGSVGGQMVKKMIEAYERDMK